MSEVNIISSVTEASEVSLMLNELDELIEAYEENFLLDHQQDASSEDEILELLHAHEMQVGPDTDGALLPPLTHQEVEIEPDPESCIHTYKTPVLSAEPSEYIPTRQHEGPCNFIAHLEAMKVEKNNIELQMEQNTIQMAKKREEREQLLSQLQQLETLVEQMRAQVADVEISATVLARNQDQLMLRWEQQQDQWEEIMNIVNQ